MGVNVKFQELCPDNYTGKTYSEHAKLASLFEGKVVAIDGSMFICQAYNGQRIRALQDASITQDGATFRQSVLLLFVDRITQMLRYGAHPVVVLDGVVPQGKRDVSSGSQRSDSMVSRLVQQLCKYMAIPCLVAPSEGEAFCAALNAQGAVDYIWTKDVVDALMFGAKAVMRECSHGKKDDGRSNQATLCYKTPATSEVAVLRHTAMAQRFGCMEEHLPDVTTCFSTLVGTDFNGGGLQTYGPKKSEDVTAWLHKAWQQDYHTVPFESFLKDVIGGIIDLQGATKQMKTFLQYAKDASKVDSTEPPFGEQLQMVFSIVRHQQRQARAAAAKHSREQLYWDGSKVQHAEVVYLLEQNQPPSKDSAKDSRNPPTLRVLNLEAEHMLRSRAQSCMACARIVSVAKVKGFGKDEKEPEDTDGMVDAQCYQYLVNIELNPSFDGFDRSDKQHLQDVNTRLQQYLEDTIQKKSGTWVAGARIARKSALVANWPKVLQDWKSKKAGKTQAANPKAQKAADRAQKLSEKKAAKSQLGTINSFFGKSQAPFASKEVQEQSTPPANNKAEAVTVRGLRAHEPTTDQTSLSKGVRSNLPSTPASQPRKKNVFQSLATPPSTQQNAACDRHSSDSKRFEHAALSSDSALSSESPPSSDQQIYDGSILHSSCAQSKEEPVKRVDVYEPIDDVVSKPAPASPLKKRAVSLCGSEDTPSPVKLASPTESLPRVIDLVGSPATLALKFSSKDETGRSCVDLTCDSDCD